MIIFRTTETPASNLSDGYTKATETLRLAVRARAPRMPADPKEASAVVRELLAPPIAQLPPAIHGPAVQVWRGHPAKLEDETIEAYLR